MVHSNIENNNKLNRRIDGISVISSATCNLQCQFCYLHKNQSYKNFNKIVREAWQTGQYVENIKDVILKIGANPDQIKIFQLWGGETFLNIKDITPNIEKINLYFPNLNSWKVSTNWTTNVDDIFNFLVELDNKTNHHIEFTLQCSIDGPEGVYTEEGHNVKWDKYKENYDNFLNLVNNYKFKKLHITFMINATVSKTTYLNKFSDYEEMKNYIQSMSDLCSYIDSRCISKSIDMGQAYIFPGYAMPHESTVEEGKQLASIFRLWEEVRAKEFNNIVPFCHFGYGIGELSRELPLLDKNLECSELLNSITINPDGTIVECNSSYIDHYEEYQEELKQEGKEKELAAAKLRKYISYNPLNMTEEEIEHHDWYIADGMKNNQSTYMHLMVSLCEEMALSGQIPYKYLLDKDLLVKHLTLLTNTTSCTRENIKDTKIPYLPSTSCIRKFMNGAIEYVYDIKHLELVEKMHEELRNKKRQRMDSQNNGR